MTRRTDTAALDDALRSLDPAPAALAPDERQRAGALLARIVATDPAADPAADPGQAAPAPRGPAARPRRRLVLAGGVVAATAAVVLALPSLTGGDEAFAGWSPVPVELTGAERDVAVAACAALQTDGGELAAAPGAAPTALVAEARGGWSYVLYRVDAAAGGELEGSCLMPDEVVEDPDPDGGGWFGGLGSADEGLPAVRRPGGVRESTSGVGAVDDGVFGYAEGRVGDDVERLVVVLADGREVEASVADDRWAVWWPAGEDGARDVSVTGAWTYRATLRDGTVLGPVDG